MEWGVTWVEAGDLQPGDTINWAGLPRRVLSCYRPEPQEVHLRLWGAPNGKPFNLETDSKFLVQKLGDRAPYKIDNLLSIQQMKERADEHGRIWGIIEVDLDDLVDRGFEASLDYISECLTETELLMDFGYTVIGHSGDTLHLYVEGDASMILDLYGEEVV